MSRIRSILRRTYGSDVEPSTGAVHVRWLREKLAVRFGVTAVAGSLLGIVLAFIRAGNIRKVQPQVLIADQ